MKGGQDGGRSKWIVSKHWSGLTPSMTPKAIASCMEQDDLLFIFFSPPQPGGLVWFSASCPIEFLSPRVASRGKLFIKREIKRPTCGKVVSHKRGLEKPSGFG